MNMMRVLSSIKRRLVSVLAHTLYYSGALFLLRNLVFRNRVLILTYHRILPKQVSAESFSHNSIIVNDSLFEQQLLFLKRHFNIASIKSFNTQLQKSSVFDKPTCLITMDDGWIDNYQYAFPLLNKLQVPAIIFLPIEYIGENKLFWQERLSRALYEVSLLDSEKARLFLKKINLTELAELPKKMRKPVIHDFIIDLKQQSYTDIQLIIDHLKEITNFDDIPNDIDRYLNWKQVTEMSQAGIDFGSHACSHRILTRISENEVRDELNRSAIRIREINDDIPLTIAYPNGNSNQSVQKITKQSGYQLAFGTQNGYVSPTDNQFDLKRINVNETTTGNMPEFLFSMVTRAK